MILRSVSVGWGEGFCREKRWTVRYTLTTNAGELMEYSGVKHSTSAIWYWLKCPGRHMPASTSYFIWASRKGMTLDEGALTLRQSLKGLTAQGTTPTSGQHASPWRKVGWHILIPITVLPGGPWIYSSAYFWGRLLQETSGPPLLG